MRLLWRYLKLPGSLICSILNDNEAPADAARGLLYESRRFGMTYEEALAAVPKGKYRHFKGNEYEVIEIARHSETLEPMVVYRALYGEGGVWVRPAEMWNQLAGDGSVMRFTRIE